MSAGNATTELEMSPVGMGISKVSQWVKYSDFTDGGSTSGTLDLTQTLPVGAFVLGTKVKVTTGFSGDTTATLAVGNTSDTNKYTDNTTVNVLAAATVGESAEDPLEFIASATTVRLTVTGAVAFSSIGAGKMLVEVFYFSTKVELGKGHPLTY